MSLHLFDGVMISWLIVGTVIIKAMQRGYSASRRGRMICIIVAIVMGAAPLIALKAEFADYSVLSIVLGGIGMFWFAILASRSANAT